MTTAMSPRFSFHAQLSAIMETMVKTTFPQVCKLVEQDSFELRTELSRLKVANAALVEKLYSLEKELLLARSEAAKLHKSCRTVGVQAGDSSRETESPTIEGVFGKDWCMGLWKDRNTRSMERVGSSTQRSDKSMVPFSNEITVIEVKEDYVAGSCPQETLRLNLGAEHEERLAHETEEPSIEYSPEIGNFSLSLDPEEEEVVSAGVPPGEPSLQLRSINDDDICSPHVIPISEDQEDEEVVSAGVPPGEPSLQLRSINDDDICSPHVIPISEDSDDDDDDVEFIEVSEQPTLPADSKNDTAPDRGAHDNFNDSSSNKDRLTCKICNHTFVHKRTLTRHMKSHKSNYCQICKQSFKKNQLKQHKCEPPVRTSMTCEWCGKAFKNPSSLMVHSRVHSGETPHTCTVCGKGFGQKGNLKIHLRIHTGEKPFQCVTCGKTFTQKSSLTSHLTSHRKEAAKRQTPSAQPVKT